MTGDTTKAKTSGAQLTSGPFLFIDFPAGMFIGDRRNPRNVTMGISLTDNRCPCPRLILAPSKNRNPTRRNRIPLWNEIVCYAWNRLNRDEISRDRTIDYSNYDFSKDFSYLKKFYPKFSSFLFDKIIIKIK